MVLEFVFQVFFSQHGHRAWVADNNVRATFREPSDLVFDGCLHARSGDQLGLAADLRAKGFSFRIGKLAPSGSFINHASDSRAGKPAHTSARSRVAVPKV